MLVGLEKDSCREMVGNSIASPPLRWTPRFAASMSCGTLAWHGLNCENVLMIPMIGRERASSPNPAALMNALRRKREKWESPYDARPCRSPVDELIGVERS